MNVSLRPVVDSTSTLPIKQLVLDAVTSPHTRRAYDRALSDFLRWYDEEGRPRLDRALIQHYVAHLQEDGMSEGTINQRLSALRKLAREAAENGLLDEQLARGIEGVKGIRQEGERTGNWLTKNQAQALLDAPDTQTLRGLRDRAILAVFLGCGLRREELAKLTFQHVQQREGAWAIVDLVGKRNKWRSVPMANWVKVALDEWTEEAQITTGPLFRPINKGGVISEGALSAQAVRDVVVYYCTERHLGTIAPHDLRRTFSKLARKGGVPLEQIQLSLGHTSLETTQRYLGAELDFTDPPGERFGLIIRQRRLNRPLRKQPGQEKSAAPDEKR